MAELTVNLTDYPKDTIVEVYPYGLFYNGYKYQVDNLNEDKVAGDPEFDDDVTFELQEGRPTTEEVLANQAELVPENDPGYLVGHPHDDDDEQAGFDVVTLSGNQHPVNDENTPPVDVGNEPGGDQ